MTKIAEWLRRAESALDARGRWAWIAAMVAGFILVWPVGLAILGYMIWSGKMGCSHRRMRRNAYAPTGNTAFDDYRRATLERLEEEREAFGGFMEKLRRARDKAEFDQFMTERKAGDPQSA